MKKNAQIEEIIEQVEDLKEDITNLKTDVKQSICNHKFKTVSAISFATSTKAEGITIALEISSYCTHCKKSICREITGKEVIDAYNTLIKECK